MHNVIYIFYSFLTIVQIPYISYDKFKLIRISL